MVAIQQLTLWDLCQFEVECPRCGHHFNPTQTRAQLIEAVLEHPAVRALPLESRQFLRLSPPDFLVGMTLGVARWEHETVYTRSAAYKQLAKLRLRGLVERVPKVVAGGKYHQYRLRLETGNNGKQN